eukprot:1325921-Rhodomonas_salina.1
MTRDQSFPVVKCTQDANILLRLRSDGRKVIIIGDHPPGAMGHSGLDVKDQDQPETRPSQSNLQGW